MRPTILVLLMFLFLGAVSWAQTSSSTEASAAERLGLKYYSTAFEETPPQWARRRGQSAIEIALGWSVARQLLAEGYVSRFPLRDDTAGVPIGGQSIARRLIEIYPSCQN